jgi:hypothetical protein
MSLRAMGKPTVTVTGGGGAGVEVGGVRRGHDDARPPAFAVERRYDVVEVEPRRGRLRRWRRPGANVAGREGLPEGAAAIVGERVHFAGPRAAGTKSMTVASNQEQEPWKPSSSMRTSASAPRGRSQPRTQDLRAGYLKYTGVLIFFTTKWLIFGMSYS